MTALWISSTVVSVWQFSFLNNHTWGKQECLHFFLLEFLNSWISIRAETTLDLFSVKFLTIRNKIYEDLTHLCISDSFLWAFFLNAKLFSTSSLTAFSRYTLSSGFTRFFSLERRFSRSAFAELNSSSFQCGVWQISTEPQSSAAAAWAGASQSSRNLAALWRAMV